jgi:hypothetical protein
MAALNDDGEQARGETWLERAPATVTDAFLTG